MGIPIGVSDLKGVGGGEGYSKRQTLGSQELPKPSTHFERLPVEILEMVAAHLKNQEELKSFSEISTLTKCSVLNLFNHQAIKELKVFSDLYPSKPEQPSSVIDIYKEFVSGILHPNSVLGYYKMPMFNNKLQELQQALTAFATNQAAERLRKLNQECYEEIIRGKASFESIDGKYASLKSELVCDALKVIIPFANFPEFIIRDVCYHAAEKGYLSVVQALLADGAKISEEYRGRAVALAAQNGHLKVVAALLADGAKISEEYRGLAFIAAASKDHLEIIQFLLAKGNIPEFAINNAVKAAAEKGYLRVVERLLKIDAKIFDSTHSWAVSIAARNGHFDVVKCLLVYRRLSGYHRKLAIDKALEGRQSVIAEFLKHN